MQVGTFFEFYGVNNATEKIGDSQTVAELLNIQLSRRNKAILENSRCNALMAGFPINSLKRFKYFLWPFLVKFSFSVAQVVAFLCGHLI
jgi:hypothetical protein